MSASEAFDRAVAFVESGGSVREALLSLRAADVESVLHAQLGVVDAPVVARGLGASPGAGTGRAYFDVGRALDAFDAGEDIVLVRPETSPADVDAMAVAEAIVTSRGGLTSHAAVVARGWGKPAVCGADGLVVADDHAVGIDGVVVREGDVVAVDGTSGLVHLGEVEVHRGVLPAAFATVLAWADEIRADRLAVRANADTADDARRARELGADGIGLCRTEHMFLGDRLPVVRRLILASTPAEEALALDELLEVQRDDFIGVLEAMDGLPVTVRLLDAPLHEFVPDVAAEVNPMLGLRGVRLGIVKDGLYRMQVRALCEAVWARIEAGGTPLVEIMVPLVVTRAELDVVQAWIHDEITRVLGSRPDVAEAIGIGVMIETPRAALAAAELAAASAFFSFGTNDLTQLTFGFSRDDVVSLLGTYLERDLLPADPFRTIDRAGVGRLVRLAAEEGRATRPALRLGVCGEHGGDPDSIGFFASCGIDAVSCSPFRVPIARLAAAQALLRDGS